MICITIKPKGDENLYGQMLEKERDLRNKGQGTLHIHGPKKRNQQTWTHVSYHGKVKFQKCLSNTIVAEVSSRNQDQEWQLLGSFIGFLDRNFRDIIENINISYN